MKVVIEKTEDGKFFVSKESEESGQAESATQEGSEMADKQPARDIKEALMMAGKLLMMDDGNSMFDQGVALTKPTPIPPRPAPGAAPQGGQPMPGRM